VKSLGHLRVLDLTHVLAGPWCTQLLADLGADVIKIERPGTGDDTRGWGPPYLKDSAGAETSEAAYYLAANRGKRSVTLDISTSEGQSLLRTLAAHCDIVVENYKVDQLAKYGLDYASLVAINPKLIYCSITGFGQTGPNRARAGYDFIMQGIGGFMSITGERDDRPGGGPQKAGVAVSDLMAGMYSAVAILAAVTHRERTGEGQYIDMALYDVMLAMLANMNMNYLTSGKAPGRSGNAHPNIVPYQVFAASDGHIIVAVGNDSQFGKFCEVAGVPQLATDPRYRRNADRVRNREALISVLAHVLQTQSVASWVGSLDAAGVPCGPINDIAHALADPQALARGMRIDLPHPGAGTVPMVANPIKSSATPPVYERAPPTLGQHTESVLREFAKIGDAELQRLKSRGVI